MSRSLQAKMREALASIAPITGIVLVLALTAAPLSAGVIWLFVASALLLIVGTGLFTLGADMAMMPMGEALGATLTAQRKLPLLIVATLVLGVLITVAEPDLSVLAGQVPGVPNGVLIGAVAAGVGIFLVSAILRIVFQKKLSYILFAAYCALLMLAVFAPEDYLAVAFDSGGVTTGPVTVPFILALGTGVASVRAGKGAREDSFGLVALSSIGPVLAVLLLTMTYRPDGGISSEVAAAEVGSAAQMAQLFASAFPEYFLDVGTALLPIVAVFAIFQVTLLKLPTRELGRIGVGLVYTYIGLVLFLTGVNVGFMPVGYEIGQLIGASDMPWILVPIGAVVGFFVVMAEPAVHVLNQQVEEITVGSVSKTAMLASLSMGVALSVAIAMARVLWGFEFWWVLVPGYALALLLMFVSPPIFTAIAFDSGGVASGPMTATFLLPFAMGACEALGGNVLQDAFGLVAMVALTPLVTIQLLGLSYKRKAGRSAEPRLEAGVAGTVRMDTSGDVIDLGAEGGEVLDLGADGQITERPHGERLYELDTSGDIVELDPDSH